MRIVDMGDPESTLMKIRRLFDEMSERGGEWAPHDCVYLIILLGDYMVERMKEAKVSD